MIAIKNPFFSLMLPFQKNQSSDMLALMFNPCYKVLGLVIQYVGKERA
jgi:hypothetical protein